ncbi:MAG: MerR family transcriptional regulator, copper efflux regulator [Actinomycetota bacterium]|nr:MerR family transcriptional regulator, copper efflux regulator [Actinomycetota bacterium]
MGEHLLRIGELAARAGVSARTVDFYTGLGLLTPGERTVGNFRLYHASDVQRIAAIRRLEAHGMRLRDICSALADPSVRNEQSVQETEPEGEDGTSELAQLLDALEHDLRTLRAMVDETAPQAHHLLTNLTVRAQGLITTALALTGDLSHLHLPI